MEWAIVFLFLVAVVGLVYLVVKVAVRAAGTGNRPARSCSDRAECTFAGSLDTPGS